MDVNIASSILFDWFDSHDSYIHASDYKRLNWAMLFEEPNPNEKEHEASILAAIDLLTEDKFVYKLAGTKKDESSIWVVIRSQKNATVDIEVSKSTAEKVANVVNSILPMLDINITEKSHPKSLGEADVLVLLQGFNLLSERLNKFIESSEKKK